VGPHYDPLLAKLIARGSDREQARHRLIEALRETTILGVVTNQSFLIQVLESDLFRRGETTTTTLESTSWLEPEIPPEVRAAARRMVAASSDDVSPWRSLGPFRVGL
jgi:geranyl-CoA carboxylase alpha subunit